MSDKEKIKTTVNIHKKSYTIVGTESRDHIEHIAELVDGKMKEIYDANRNLDVSRLAVLTAINTMNDYVKLKEEYDELIKLIEEED
ncbi:MAG TPA: cell division protein ZapA [Pseudogracilibacillus sp.]|nr:cell division protein ZapA [Pseudogracilibacillus sp.]